jgi:uncharacterized protein (TIGR00255 family)
VLLSMTGFGDARRSDDQLNVAVEIRTVNNRYLKISTKRPEAYAVLESDIDKVVRGVIARGTVSITIRLDRAGAESQFRLNHDVLGQYWKQLGSLADSIHVAAPNDLSSLLTLPGVVTEEGTQVGDPREDWPLIREVLTEALESLNRFRHTEGQSMAGDLRDQSNVIGAELDKIRIIAPQVVSEYRDRIHERVSELLRQTDVTVDPSNLIREVSIFSDRCDINEEITRLKSHLEQYETFLDDETSQGRKLEFLSQEMFREINTIGSKANNVAIAHAVVEMKSAVEKTREILQNVE